jgi:dihydroorotate dehydrogenase (NAD+) catalytic subunit
MPMIDLAPGNPYGLTIAHPLTAAAGFLGNISDVARLFGLQRDANAGVALAVTREALLERGDGRAAVLVESGAAAVYRPAVSPLTLQQIEDRLAETWAELAVPVLVGVRGPDARAIAAALDGRPGIAGFELSSDEADATRLQRAVSELRRRTQLPLVVRLAGLGGQLSERAAAATAGGADTLALLDAIPAAAVDRNGRLQHGQLIGPALFPLILAAVDALAGRLTVPLIAGGGVHTVAQVRALLAAGAAAVSLDSLLWRGPAAARALLDQLQAPAA